MPLNVLIIDDSAVMRKIVQRSVRLAYKGEIGDVVEARDGQEALDMLEGNSVSLIFSDINMPNVNGLEFLKKVEGHRSPGPPGHHDHDPRRGKDREGGYLAGR